MANEDNPYSLIYAELWAVLESSPSFCALVPVGNRIKLTDKDRSPFKPESITADYPTVSIIDAGGMLGQQGSSSSVVHSKTWKISTATGDMRLTYLHFPLEWAIVSALFRERTARSRLLALQWRGHDFVSRVAFGTTSSAIAMDASMNAIKGWSEILSVRTDLSIGLDWVQE